MISKKQHTVTGRLNTGQSSSLSVLNVIKSKKNTLRASKTYKQYNIISNINEEDLDTDEQKDKE